MEILIIEDDEIKSTQIKDFLKDSFKSIDISFAKSIQSAIKMLKNSTFNLILLDMTLPTFDFGVNDDGGRIRAYGGREILRQMDRKKIVTPVIVITQFDKFGKGSNTLALDELNKELKKDHKNNYKGCVYYNAAYENWKYDLLTKLEQYIKKDEND
ncbi:response regulator [uncultured Desulfosarcina sp.]|uniref:response regulator n=1 Tax=uncultured Desulfosarcina sp. TaxID=218289 RepID=UPI0029C80FCB|nr:response regulator [uncultured Desulfosarcina sp.]